MTGARGHAPIGLTVDCNEIGKATLGRGGDMQAQNYSAILIAIQIAFLGWRINREIPLGDQGRRTWFPISDYLNVISMFLVVWFCIVGPLNSSGQADDTAKLVLSVGFALVVMHPINMIGHYRFLTRNGRHVYTLAGRDYPYVTGHEWVTLILTALVVLYVVVQSPLLVHYFAHGK